MEYIVKSVGPTSFIKDIKNPRVSLMKDGEVVDEKPYRHTHIPGAKRSYIPQTHKGKKVISLTQEELNDLVKEMNLYNRHNEKIEEAPINNPNADFWKHPRIRTTIDLSGTKFDDSDPFGKFWYHCFEADKDFQVGEDNNPAMASVRKYKVINLKDDIKEHEKEADDVTKAMSLLSEMGFQRKVKILKAMGVRVSDPEPEVVDRNLTRKVVLQKDEMIGHQTHLELFFELAKDDLLDLKSVVQDARDNSIIQKHSSKGYMFGSVELGKTLSKVYNFLADEENNEILQAIMKQTEQK